MLVFILYLLCSFLLAHVGIHVTFAMQSLLAHVGIYVTFAKQSLLAHVGICYIC